jgi:hypothetical protein
MAYNNIYRAIRGMIKRDTGKAILFVARNPDALTPEDEELEAWLPKSQISSISILRDGSGDAVIFASEWILKQKDWMHLPTYKPAPSSPAFGTVGTDDDIPF